MVLVSDMLHVTYNINMQFWTSALWYKGKTLRLTQKEKWTGWTKSLNSIFLSEISADFQASGPVNTFQMSQTGHIYDSVRNLNSRSYLFCIVLQKYVLPRHLSLKFALLKCVLRFYLHVNWFCRIRSDDSTANLLGKFSIDHSFSDMV